MVGNEEGLVQTQQEQFPLSKLNSLTEEMSGEYKRLDVKTWDLLKRAQSWVSSNSSLDWAPGGVAFLFKGKGRDGKEKALKVGNGHGENYEMLSIDIYDFDSSKPSRYDPESGEPTDSVSFSQESGAVEGNVPPGDNKIWGIGLAYSVTEAYRQEFPGYGVVRPELRSLRAERFARIGKDTLGSIVDPLTKAEEALGLLESGKIYGRVTAEGFESIKTPSAGS